MIQLDGKVAIVTGAASGIGRATALKLSAAGALVYAIDLDASGAALTASLARALGGEVVPLIADVSCEEEVEAFTRRAFAERRRLDLVHNNAALAPADPPRRTADWDEAELRAILAVNVRGVFLGMKHALKLMERQGHGAIVNTASVYGQVGAPFAAPYVASKHAVLGLTDAEARRQRRGIRVNAICPGLVRSPMALRAAPRGSITDKGRVSISAATADDVAEVVLWLASDGARHVNGQHIVVG